MLRALLAIGLCLASAATARAEQVAAQTGEHNGFTRLVLDFEAPVGWQMTRTTDGYRLALDRPDMRFDLTGVFGTIPRTRLASVWADPENGDLMLGIGCACHAFPFELRPDVLVIDLRDGPPPPGSSFEVAEDGQTMPPITPRTATRPRGRPKPDPSPVPAAVAGGAYNWLDQVASRPAMAPPPMPATKDATAPRGDVPGPTAQVADAPQGDAPEPAAHAIDAPQAAIPEPAVHAADAPRGEAPGPTTQVAEAPDGAGDALRDEMLRQISNGAARGTVELAPNVPRQSDGHSGTSGHDPAPQIRIGGDAGVDPTAGDRPENVLTAEGDRCLPDTSVDLGAWGADTPVAETIAARTGTLFGEFDRVDQAAADSAVRYLLHLGFGAETRQLIEVLPLDGPDAALWTSLAAVVDGDLAPDGPLAGMEVCDGAVAFWAALAQPDLTSGDKVQTGAILRTFSALPLHLRRHLGPTLADRFLAQGDTGAVRAIRDAILRPGGDPGPAVRMMEAELGSALGNHDPGALIALQSAPGRTAAAATIAAVRAIVAEGGIADMGLLTATEALLREYKGAEEEPALHHALALAQATQGDFDAAFAQLPEGDTRRGDLWALLAERGPEGAVMTHALRGGVAQIPQVPQAVTQRMARRLIDLGFPDAALDWLNAGMPTEGAVRERRLLLAAEAELGRRDARAAVGLLADVAGPEAAALRNAGLLQLGTPEPLERLRADAAAPEMQRQQAARMALDWDDVAEDGPDVWRNAAVLVIDSPVLPDAPPLARAKALLEDSIRARAALKSLMEATLAPPDQPAAGGT